MKKEGTIYTIIFIFLVSFVFVFLLSLGRFAEMTARHRAGELSDALARLAAPATAPRPDPTVRLDHIRRTFLSIRDAAQIVLDRLGNGRLEP